MSKPDLFELAREVEKLCGPSAGCCKLNDKAEELAKAVLALRPAAPKKFSMTDPMKPEEDAAACS